jgi:hypothetical protein
MNSRQSSVKAIPVSRIWLAKVVVSAMALSVMVAYLAVNMGS